MGVIRKNYTDQFREEAVKRITLAKILRQAGVSVRTLQRWKQSYRCNGINGIAPEKRGRPPKKEIPCHIAKLIEHYRKEYL